MIIAAYLMGSLSAAIIVSKIMGLPDPRTDGSKNPGATNVLRLGSKKGAIITLLGDMLKGLLPVLIVKAIGVSDLVLALVAFAAFIGHLYPVFFGFKGGKGVATALGVLIGIHWLVGLLVIATWLIMAFISRYSSLSALVACGLAPLYTFYITSSNELAIMNVVLSAILFWRHRGNIRNLINGTETKIGQK
jgi:glycerol-3-phosphate acyltransferase PlsY